MFVQIMASLNVGNQLHIQVFFLSLQIMNLFINLNDFLAHADYSFLDNLPPLLER